jgi:protein involved in polysaccharide export with SLBB domain
MKSAELASFGDRCAVAPFARAPAAAWRLVFRAAAVGTILLGACSSVRNPTPVSSLPPTTMTTRYVISTGDELEVRFFHTPELNVVLPVRPDGYISLPLAQEVVAAGKTPQELRDELITRYERELQRPEIAVIARTFAAHRVHVGGEVDRPGVLQLAGRMTVLDAVMATGGYLRTARLDEVLVIRATPQGSYAVVPVNLHRVLDGTDPTQNIALAPYDAVFVPRSVIAGLNDFVQMYIKNMIPVDFAVRYNLGDLVDPD